MSIQVTNKETPHGALYSTEMYKCHTRVYPTSKMKRLLSMIMLGLNTSPPGWCALQKDISPVLPLPRWLHMCQCNYHAPMLLLNICIQLHNQPP